MICFRLLIRLKSRNTRKVRSNCLKGESLGIRTWLRGSLVGVRVYGGHDDLLEAFDPLVRATVKHENRGGQGLGVEVQGAGFRVQGAGCRVQGSGCSVQGTGYMV